MKRLTKSTPRFYRSLSGGMTCNPKFEPILISIEGNIGAGKSTLLEDLRLRHPEWTFIDEPVNRWTQLKTDQNESLLEIFYRDRKRWSYTFQNCALLTRYQMIEEAVSKVRSSGQIGKHVFITERCLDTDYHVFTKMLREDGSMDGLEIELYELLLNELRSTSTPLAAIIHVDTPPEVCSLQIIQRGRQGEQNISLSYLESLDKYQCNWVDALDIPCLKTTSQMEEKIEEFIQDLLK